MALELPPASRQHTNRPFKSSGENRLEIEGDAQMTDTTMIWHATGEQTNGSVQLAEIIWRNPDVSLHHIHEFEDEGFFVIEGSMTIHGPEGDIELGPGEFGWGPRGVRHGYSIGPDGARVLMVQTPGTLLHEFFRSANEVSPEHLVDDPNALESFNAWSADQYGIHFFDPADVAPGSQANQNGGLNMGLDEKTRGFLNMANAQPSPPPGEIPLEQFRAAINALAPLGLDREEIKEVREATVAGPDGDVPVRVYIPDTAAPPPLLLCVHGGSWVRVTLADMDNYYRTLANLTGCALAAVDYTLSPEAQYPQALEECYAAAKWAQENRSELGCRSDRLGLMGESSGGNMAAALALIARDRGEVTFSSQALILPVLDGTFASASWGELGTDYMLTQDQLDWALSQYAPDADRTDPLISPVFADDLSGLPPTLLVRGEFDPLRDEGEQYAERLREAGVEVDDWLVEGLIHHAMMVPKAIPLGREALDGIGQRIARLESGVPS